MDRSGAAALAELLLNLGLAVTTRRTDAGYTCEISGGRQPLQVPLRRELIAMKVGVFLHGTAIMHAAAAGVERDERVRQVRRREPSVRDFASYVPTPGTAAKLAAWHRHGATIIYLSSHRCQQDIRADEAVIRRHGFPAGPVYGRQDGEDYGLLVERLRLDGLVEDDCESIGGAAQACAAQLSPAGRRRFRRSARTAGSFGPVAPPWTAARLAGS